MSEVKFKMAAGTNVGLVRTNNEDNFVVCPDLGTSTWLIPQDGNYADLGDLGALLVVADGMGGANAGEVASAICVDTIQRMFTPDRLVSIVTDEKAVQQFMSDVVKTADLNIKKQGRKSKSTKGMGTTVVMAWILGRRAYICWCGDSRCYVYNRKRGLKQISKDHSFVQELVDGGVLRPELASEHPLSNVITRCLGDVEKRANPDTRVYELYSGDTIMLCSDGLSGFCPDEFIAQIVAALGQNPLECRNALIDAALHGGGADNVTVALCTVNLDSEEVEASGEVEIPVIQSRDGINATLKPYELITDGNGNKNINEIVDEQKQSNSSDSQDIVPNAVNNENEIGKEEMSGSQEEPSEKEMPPAEEVPFAEDTEDAVVKETLADPTSKVEETTTENDVLPEIPAQEAKDDKDKTEDMTEGKTSDEESVDNKKEEKDQAGAKVEKQTPARKSYWLRYILWFLLFVAIMAVIYIWLGQDQESKSIRDFIIKECHNIFNHLKRPEV
jgi:protein phosphatase